MITPELIVPNRSEFIFVANHGLQTEEALTRSLAFNRARIAHARKHLPCELSRCVVTYDLRGQTVSAVFQKRIHVELADLAEVRILS